MTITISPQTETMLKEQAGRTGQNADLLADAMLQEMLLESAHDFEEACAAISEALASDPADDISLDEYRAQFKADRAARRAARITQVKQAVA